MTRIVLKNAGFAAVLGACVLVLGGVAPAQIAVEWQRTEFAYMSHNGAPVLSFGGGSDAIFWLAEDAFDYRRWADWAAAHGMNHLRAYPPLSWKHIDYLTQVNGGSQDNVLYPYAEAPGSRPGARQFDLDSFNDAYWKRFREQMKYLESKGIVVHLLMINGWQLLKNDLDWIAHFHNPANNINSYTEHLGGFLSNRFRYYTSVAERKTDLVEAQKRWLKKIIDETYDLDNVYYDLVHEVAGNRPKDWRAVQAWVEEMSATVRSYYKARSGRDIVLGMDTGGLTGSERDWIFKHENFDVLIYGKAHSVSNARAWRQRYKKPYIPQEAWDDNGEKYAISCPEQRVHARKYVWKLMMQKAQQIDFYYRQRDWKCSSHPKTRHGDQSWWFNFDPSGVSGFEGDARVLRSFWNALEDYPDLDFAGSVSAGPGDQGYVLSSSREAVAYVASGTGEEGAAYGATALELTGLALADGAYTATVVDPTRGVVGTGAVTAGGGAVTVPLPAFTDDLAVHLAPATPS